MAVQNRRTHRQSGGDPTVRTTGSSGGGAMDLRGPAMDAAQDIAKHFKQTGEVQFTPEQKSAITGYVMSFNRDSAGSRGDMMRAASEVKRRMVEQGLNDVQVAEIVNALFTAPKEQNHVEAAKVSRPSALAR